MISKMNFCGQDEKIKKYLMPEKLLFYRRHEHNNSDFSHNTVPVMIKNRIVFLRALHRQLRRLKN